MTALWRLSFRPFFLFGAAFATLAIGGWILILQGVLPAPSALDPVTWHAHEMVFGFGVAIIVGFVLTAAQNWSGVRGAHGLPLMILFAAWALPRALLAFWPHPAAWLACLDLAVYPLAGLLLWPALRDPELKIERVFYLFLTLFFCGSLVVHLDALGVTQGLSGRGIQLGLNTIILVIVFIGGRVIPFFTESSVARSQPKTRPGIEIAAHASSAVFVAAQLGFRESALAALIALAAAAIHLARLSGWQVPRVRRVPLIWVLHLAYLWIVAGYILAAAQSMGWIASAIPIHAFAVGGMGVAVLGMISRVSLGHTGRRLHPSRGIVAAYVLLNLSAIARVFGPLFADSRHLAWISVAGSLWIAAFGLFVILYAPILWSARLDGRDG